MSTRRDFLQWLAALGATPGVAMAASESAAVRPAPKRLAILFLGGTGFLGPHQVRHALARGHRVTLFNRGRSAPGLFGSDVEVLLGDRDARVGPGLSALGGARRWDVVIDNSGYVPRHVRDSIDLLQHRCDRYLFVSTVAAYDPPPGGGRIDEAGPLRAAPSPQTETVSGATYGALKAECDRIVQAQLGRRATIVRPTYIVGPGDDTDRFTYWIERAARGGEALAPPDPEARLQWVDVRDLCPWVVELAEGDVSGIFNAAGPPMTWRDVLHQLAAASSTPVDWRWATDEVLQRSGVSLPLVRPRSGGAWPHFDGARAQASGLRYRPLADTAAATLEWWRSQPAERRANPEDWPSEAQEREALRLLAAAA
ncbi:MAG TPA: NAD-dependent epimerase/dehydratase family protein [Steroidobacteraceae bacterium]|nr:NAD-dependent epimerase/dehydratase family protein [Steroidobacteraceae bacterium]